MKSAVINIKTDPHTKVMAHKVADQLGIPLSILLNAYLHELASTGSVHFSVAEPMTKDIEAQIERAQADIAAGDVSGPFDTLEGMYKHLDNLK